MPSLGDSFLARHTQQRANYSRTAHHRPPMLRIDRHGKVILPAAQRSHANYEEHPVFKGRGKFHDHIWHYSVPWVVSIHPDIANVILLIARQSSGRRYKFLQRRQLYVYIVPKGADF